jgi:hypothetical protein
MFTLRLAAQMLVMPLYVCWKDYTVLAIGGPLEFNQENADAIDHNPPDYHA